MHLTGLTPADYKSNHERLVHHPSRPSIMRDDYLPYISNTIKNVGKEYSLRTIAGEVSKTV